MILKWDAALLITCLVMTLDIFVFNILPMYVLCVGMAICVVLLGIGIRSCIKEINSK